MNWPTEHENQSTPEIEYGPLEILYQDEHYVAINKPAGLLVHKTYLARKERFFAMQLLRDQLNQYVYPIHRLDRPTSGVLLFALSSQAARKGCECFAERGAKKGYLAIVRGYMNEAGYLDYPLKEELDDIADKQARSDKPAQEAQTSYQPIATVELPYSTGRYPTSRFSLVKLTPHTGRKHQLRRHLAHLRHPIVGDTTHGDGKQNRLFRENLQSRQLLLHARELQFVHPYTQQDLTIVASVDQHWRELLTQFDWADHID